ncbi:hypothetical protein D2V05_08885 [Flagellimonas pelagia]|uniref:Uncharacterized protein n=1 Tax=Flagellimonas pelagia TaxID=2306998 RepID=A0A3A1NGT7_9FLAO|nr:hypothetical protein D2V05_08885 [Allomuricauda maritima]
MSAFGTKNGIIGCTGSDWENAQNQLYTKSDRSYIPNMAQNFCYLSWRYQKLGDTKRCIEMRKCIILFVILIVALVFAAVSEHKQIKIRSDWDNVVAKK